MSGVMAQGGGAPEGGRLESWKEIAAYLKRDLRTVQRWEKTEGLPVHRHVHNKLSSVFAYTAELEAWRATRRAELLEAETGRESRRGRRWIWAAVLAAILSVAVLTTWRFALRSRPPPPAKVVPVTTHPGIEQYPSFSADGKQIAFTWNGEKQDQFDVYVNFLGPGDPLRLTNDPAEELFPTWSPDSRWIAFLRTIHGTTRAVHVVGALGGAERKIGEVDGPLMSAPPPFFTWTPDGRTLVIVDREIPGGRLSLFLLSVETGEKRRLTNTPSWFDSSPAVSPDGRALAFVRMEETALYSVFLQALSDDFTPRGQPQRLTSEKWMISNLSWTADSRAILCSKSTEPNPGLWKIPRTGGAAIPVQSIGGRPQHLTVSRQGDRLAYTQEDRDSDIWRLELGSDRKAKPVRVVSSTQMEMTPHLSPDGTRIAFISMRSGHSEVWKSDLSGTNSVQLTRLEEREVLAPRWSPDGKEIVFTSVEDIYVVRREGGRPRRITTDSAVDLMPDWSPDGRWIYFTSSRGTSARARNAQEVWKVPADGGEPLQVSRKGGLVRSAYVSPNGRDVYYKIGDPIGSLWKVPVDGGEEVKVLDSVYRRNFQVMEDGIYFMSETKPAAGYALQFYRFQDRGVERIADIEQNVAAGFSISRDRKHIYYWTWELRAGDIMMIENLRW